MPRRAVSAALVTSALLGSGALVLCLFLGLRLLALPPVANLPLPEPEAGVRFQGALTQLLLRQGGLSSGRDPLVVTANDVNGFLSRHLQTRHLGIDRAVVRLGAGWVEIAARTSVGLVASRAAGHAAGLVPEAAMTTPVWLVLQGRITLEGGRATVEVDRLWIGRQPVPPWLFWRAAGVSPSEVLTWRVPRVMERVDVQPGRLTIHTRPGRG